MKHQTQPSWKTVARQWLMACATAALLATGCVAAAPPPNEPVHSVIVQGADVGSASAAVRAVGGEVTHELGIIRAVGADVTAAQIAALERRGGLRVRENHRVRIDSQVETFRDEFSLNAYSGSDGTRDWSGDWVESDDGSTVHGNCRIYDSSHCASGRCLKLKTDNGVGDSIYREVDLETATNATLTFGFEHDLEDDDAVVLELSADGGATWAVLETYHEGVAEPAVETLDITAYAGPATRIRFRIAEDDDGGSMWIDDLQVEATLSQSSNDETTPDPPDTGDHPAVVLDSFATISYEGDDGTLAWITPGGRTTTTRSSTVTLASTTAATASMATASSSRPRTALATR